MVPAAESRRQSPAVSVIIPTHNYARYLRDAVESVRAQTRGDWECIVVDDGSTDETPEVLARLAAEEPRLVRLSQPRRGPSAARNAGLRQAHGEFVQFLDADDLLQPTKLAAHVATLDANVHVDIVYGPTGYFDDGSAAIVRATLRGGSLPEPSSGSGWTMLEALLAANLMTIGAPLIRRTVFDCIGLFDEGLARMEDWELWLRCANAGMVFLFVPSPAPVAFVRVHPASASHSEAPMLLAEASVRQRLQPALHTRAARGLNRRRLNEARADAGKLLALDGQPRSALRWMLPAALSARRPNWLAWVFAMLLLQVPGGRSVFDRIRSSRSHRRARSS
jgi:glycosyltransferase involved in cell wall biosynthesis